MKYLKRFKELYESTESEKSLEDKLEDVPYIELIIMEPSWWKSDPIPYKEVSDSEAGII
jgi:hypothetical protein